jgi:hypothetical protein
LSPAAAEQALEQANAQGLHTWRNDFGQASRAPVLHFRRLSHIGSTSAPPAHMNRSDLMQRYLLGSLSLLFAGSIGAFLLYVPMMSALAVTTIVLGMMGMFALGFMARRPRIRRRNLHTWSVLPGDLAETKILPWPTAEPTANVTELRPSSRR